MKQKVFHTIALIGLTFLTAVFFYQTLFFGKLPVPADTLVGLYHPWRDLYAQTNPRGVPFKNFLITDPVRQQIPWRKMSIDAWKSGHIPSWNPYNFAGVPLDANIQAAAFYPFNILFFLFQFPVAWSMLVMIQPLLAGLFLYLYLKHLKLSTFASFFGAVSWSFSGFSIAWLSWGTMMQTAMWVPLVLLSLDTVLTAKRKSEVAVARWSVIAVAGVVMIMLAGHIQIALYTMVVAIVYGLWRFRNLPDIRYLRNRAGKKVKLIMLAGVLLSAVGWYPLVQFLPETVRLTLAESATRPGWFLPWQHLLQFIVPDFFGNPATLNYWGIWNYGEFIGYIGLIPLILSASVLFSGGVASFWSCIVLMGLFFMLSHPVTMILQWANLPLLSVLQPTRLMVIVDLGLAILAAYGLDAFLKGKHKRIVWSCLFVGVCLAGAWMVPLATEHLLVTRRNLVLPTLLYILTMSLIASSFYLKRGKFFWISAMILVTVFDLFRFGWKFTPFTDSRYFFPTTNVIRFLQNQPKPFRIASLDDRILPPNVSGYFGLETIEGYDPLSAIRFENFLRVSESGNADLNGAGGYNRIYTTRNIDSVLFPYFNVQYVLSLQNLSSVRLKLVFSEGETKVYKYTDALPRVYLAEDITHVVGKTSNEILAAVLDASESKKFAVVERSLDVLSVPLSADESTQITAYDPYKIMITTHTINARLLVVLNRFDKKTRVTVDGKQARLERVNYLFSGVVVPAGTHTVELKY